MRQASTFSVLGASFVVSCLVLVSLLVNPVWAQATNEDPLAGIDVTLEDTNGDEELANRVLIPLTDCDVAENASVTVRNVDSSGQPIDPPIELVNDQTVVQIAQEPTEIVIENMNQGDLDPRLKSGVGEVVESTGITCDAAGTDPGTDPSENESDGAADDDGADDRQYADDRKVDVIIKTVPDKPLPKTGGSPLLFGAGLMLLAATVLGSRVIGRR